MRKVFFLFVSLVLLQISYVDAAQNPSDYFVGDWEVVVSGTPSGDAKMVLHLERVDGKLTGEMRAEQGDPTKINSVDEKESSIVVYYNTMGYDINLSFEKVDDNNIKGSMMGMFDAKGVRKTE